ncbi:MAG: 30S ribosomal protein S7 [Candidatus Aenigmatarchaeota archaeon]
MRKRIERIKAIKRPAEKAEPARPKPQLKLFGRWDCAGIVVNDPGLRHYINLDSRFVPRTAGRLRRPFHKSKAHIVERLATHMLVPGHAGRKHKLTSGPMGGAFYTVLKHVERALELIEKASGKNPVEVLVRAIENAALREEIITYQVGSVVAREAVITSPQRRIDKVLRFLAQGAYHRTFGKNYSLAQALADEILAAYQGKDCFAMREKERIEREAMGAR